MKAKICASILPKTVDEALALIEMAENQGADLIEVRLDLFKENKRLRNITRSTKLPTIATNRSTINKGNFSGSEAKRKQILLEAAENDFQYIDVELSLKNLKKMVDELQKLDAKIIVSFHDFNGTPNPFNLEKIFKREVANGADICKIVTTAESVEDNITVLNFVREASRKYRTVCFSMGELGRASRILSPIFGGFFTMASIEKRKETASGQMTVHEMKSMYKALGL